MEDRIMKAKAALNIIRQKELRLSFMEIPILPFMINSVPVHLS